MSKKIRVACIQMDAGASLDKNLEKAYQLLSQAVRKKVKLAIFSENFLWRGRAHDLKFIASRKNGILEGFESYARTHKVALVLGSIIEAGEREKFYNTSYLISESGKRIAKYQKIHLFDVALKDVKVHESKHIIPGKKVVVGKVLGTKVGLSICYDLRFPELFRKLTLAGSEILFVPSNFTEKTGKAHWEVLLRARAIENLCYVVAPGQTGTNPDTGIRSFGTSLIVDPWGKILAQGSQNREQIIIADLDLVSQKNIRKVFPCLKHVQLI
jgi:deaminated glutathione amidase